MSKHTYTILNKTLSYLYIKKESLEAEIEKIQNTIDGIKNLLSSIEAPVEKVKQVSRKKKNKKSIKTFRNPIITEESVRNAIIEIYRNPLPNFKGIHKLEDGFFTASQIAPLIPIKGPSTNLYYILKKFEQKGILRSLKYKNGKQYIYIPPAETGPGKDFEKIKYDINKLSSRSELSQPIPYTGNSKITFRNKDVENMVDRAKREGFKIDRLGSDHVRISKNGTGKVATISTTGRDIARYVENCKADLKRIGVNV